MRPTVRPVAASRPSTVPSPSTTAVPHPTAETFAPIQTNAQLEFTQALTLSISSGCVGLSYDVQSQTALELATAQTLQVPSSAVTYAGCSSGSSAITVATTEVLAVISANMDVQIPLSLYPTVDPSNSASVGSLFTELQQKLVSTVESGAFSKQLNSVSKYLNANVTSDAVVSKTSASGMAVQYPPTLAPTAIPPSNKSSSSNNDSMYMVIGIISGVAFLLIVAVCSLVAYLLRLRKALLPGKLYGEEARHGEDVSIANSSLYPSASTEGRDAFGSDRGKTAIIIPDSATNDSWSPCCA